MSARSGLRASLSARRLAVLGGFSALQPSRFVAYPRVENPTVPKAVLPRAQPSKAGEAETDKLA
jgi:hypothetical protein